MITVQFSSLQRPLHVELSTQLPKKTMYFAQITSMLDDVIVAVSPKFIEANEEDYSNF